MPPIPNRLKPFLWGGLAFFLILIMILGIPWMVLNLHPQQGSTEDGEEEMPMRRSLGPGEPMVTIHVSADEIVTLPMEEYLIGVIAGEISPRNDMEALKAMAVAARTFSWDRMERGIDLCATVHCQVWLSPEQRLERWGDQTAEYTARIASAVDATTGQLITYEGHVIQATYHGSCGGHTEEAKNVWGWDIPYLQSVACIEEPSTREQRFTYDELDSRLGTSLATMSPHNRTEAISVLATTNTGRAQSIRIGNEEIAGTNFRSILGLSSTNVELDWQDNELLIKTVGNGHAVGMCQTGAALMAQEGHSYQEILQHYYQNTTITKAY
ncbi:stage II sporulation protein D [Heliorestis acidaminivorans]|uniref:Stage II sporulation protein D n=1 Tax=Heliorestis acidaminivorans TaxID=553427 RepID=A0A6I0F541_9FIRM|nr:stage II sporulation protein D [Heliorestis acidaminivorans]KAB2953797.1 stage II sporulation protein D [Heliorestis acidaminivorans]